MPILVDKCLCDAYKGEENGTIATVHHEKLGLICRRAPEVLGDGSARFSTARYADRNRFVSPKPGWLVVCDDEDGDQNLIENAPGLVWINEAEPPGGQARYLDSESV